MVLYRDVVDLLIYEEGKDEDGFPTPPVETSRRTVFVNKKDVRSSEFYMANQQGVALKFMFEMHSFDYEGEEILEYEGRQYKVFRTYDKGEKIEIICTALSGDFK